MTATDSRTIDAPAESVYDVLIDADAYGDWVVGASHVRRIDAGWPARRTRFHHSLGVFPFRLRDTTELIESDPPRFLRLKVHARPLLEGIVEMHLQRTGSGTLVTMKENLTGGPLARLNRPLHPLISLRNQISLRRLEKLVKEQSLNAR